MHLNAPALKLVFDKNTIIKTHKKLVLPFTYIIDNKSDVLFLLNKKLNADDDLILQNIIKACALPYPVNIAIADQFAGVFNQLKETKIVYFAENSEEFDQKFYNKVLQKEGKSFVLGYNLEMIKTNSELKSLFLESRNQKII